MASTPPNYRLGDTLYTNPLQSPADVADFVMEGSAAVTFPQGRMRLENLLDPSLGQKANYVYWCPVDFPANIAISWDFYPIREPGLAMLLFAAKGKNGEDIFAPTLQKRTGMYNQYNSGDINLLHVSYFRRGAPTERAFQTCNLRKSAGFHLVAQGGDPLPSVADATPPYHLQVVKFESYVSFRINDLLVLSWEDDGQTHGPVLGGGKIGFRQMAPLIAEYARFEVREVLPAQ